MELELKTSCLNIWETGGEVTLTQEAAAETIVPDYCPDIARIIETAGTVCIHSREVRDGRGEVSGTVRVTVLYTPENEGGIRTMELSLPFTAESDSRVLVNCSVLSAEVSSEMLETRMLNPRKVFTHCRLCVRMTGYRRAQLFPCADVQTLSGHGVEKKQEKQTAVILTHVTEKDFTFSEEMNLSPGREGAAEILTCRVNSSVSETKVVGSKLIFKGMFSVSVLYRTAEGKCCVSVGELPFSQIMETEGAAENAVASVQLQLAGTDVQIDGGDPEGRQFAVTLYVHATALVRQEEEMALLCDLYSTACELTYDAAPLVLNAYFRTFTRRQTVREVLEIGVVAERVVDVCVNCASVAAAREGSSVMLRAPVTVRAMYADEGNAVLVAERTVEVSCQMELPKDCEIRVRAECPGEIQSSLGDRGIEVRFPVEFVLEAASQVKKVCVTAVRIDPEKTKDSTGAPSLVLRCMGRQERLWDLAKSYNTTVSAILSANRMEREEDIPREKLLLIPRKRA